MPHKRGRSTKRRSPKKRPMQELFLSFAILSIVSLPALAIGFTTSIDRTSEVNPRVAKFKKSSDWREKRASRKLASVEKSGKQKNSYYKSMMHEKW